MDIHRIPLSKGDFIALALICDKAPELYHRFQPKGGKPDPTLPWKWCNSSGGLLQGTTSRPFVATPSKGPVIPFTLHPTCETLVYSADRDGILELKIACTITFPYFFVIGKDRFTPTTEVAVKSTVEVDDPVFQIHNRYKDHTLTPPDPAGGFMVEIRLPEEIKAHVRQVLITTPDGSILGSNSSYDPAAPFLTIGRATAVTYPLRVLAITNEAKMTRSMPYEIVLWRVPDLLDLMGIQPAQP